MDHAIWTLATKDISNPQNMIVMKLRFKENGYAYEENTILSYRYYLNAPLKVFFLNGQVYDILESSKKRMILRNNKSGIELILSKD